MPKFGQFIPASKIGSTKPKHAMDKNMAKGFKPSFLFTLFVILFHTIATFAQSHKELVIGSHNLHGFKKSGEYHKSCIQRFGGVWFGQELWLQEKQLGQLQQLGTQFTAHSGMENAASAGILRGRPFGGVSIYWSPDLNHVKKTISDFRHRPIVAAELCAQNCNFLLISVYMPFFDTNNRDECIAETQDTLSMIEDLIENHPNHLVIIGGDLNTKVKDESALDNLWNDMVLKNRLAYCSHLFDSPGDTFFQNSLSHKKHLDQKLVSSLQGGSEIALLTNGGSGGPRGSRERGDAD